MKINKKVLESFLKKSFLNGNIVEGTISFNDDGLNTVNSSENIYNNKCIINKEVFEEFENLGLLGITLGKRVINLASQHKNIIDVSYTDNNLVLKSKGKSSFIRTMAVEFIKTNDNNEIFDKLSYDFSCEIDKENFDNLVKAQSFLDTKKCKLTVNGEKLFINIESEDGDKQVFDVDIKNINDENIVVTVGEMFPTILSTLDKDSKIVLKLKTDYPISIVEKTNVLEIVHVLAPIVSD